jgi:hypothetical protein
MYLDLGFTSEWGPGWLSSKKEPVQVVNTAWPHALNRSELNLQYLFTRSKHLNPDEMASREFDKFGHRPCWMLSVCWIENVFVGVIMCFLILAFTLRTKAFPTLPRRSNGLMQAGHVREKMWNGSWWIQQPHIVSLAPNKIEISARFAAPAVSNPTSPSIQIRMVDSKHIDVFQDFIEIEWHTSANKFWRVQDDEDLGSDSLDFSQHQLTQKHDGNHHPSKSWECMIGAWPRSCPSLSGSPWRRRTTSTFRTGKVCWV